MSTSNLIESTASNSYIIKRKKGKFKSNWFEKTTTYTVKPFPYRHLHNANTSILRTVNPVPA